MSGEPRGPAKAKPRDYSDDELDALQWVSLEYTLRG